MVFILSPAKNMKINNFYKTSYNNFVFKEKTLILHKVLKKFEPFQIEKLMKVNSKIALKTFINFQDFDYEKKGGQAIFSYDGLVFKNINAKDFNEKEINFAQDNVKILSAFYGILSPLDNVLPYRLEMKCPLSFENFKNLYDFWNNYIYIELFKNNDIIVNLASDEYFKVLYPYIKNKDKVLDIEFLTFKNGKYKNIPTASKILRGQMINFIVKNQIKNLNDLKNFSFNNYYFNDEFSNSKKFIYIQKLI